MDPGTGAFVHPLEIGFLRCRALRRLVALFTRDAATFDDFKLDLDPLVARRIERYPAVWFVNCDAART